MPPAAPAPTAWNLRPSPPTTTARACAPGAGAGGHARQIGEFNGLWAGSAEKAHKVASATVCSVLILRMFVFPERVSFLINDARVGIFSTTRSLLSGQQWLYQALDASGHMR